MNVAQRIISTDIGGSHLCSCIIDLNDDYNINDFKVYNKKYDAFASANEILDSWGNHFSQLSKYSQKLAIAIPGPFNYEQGIFTAPHGRKLGSLHGMDLTLTLKEILQSDLTIKFANDAYCFGLGESKKIEDANDKIILYLTLGTGLGSCIINHGHLVKETLDLKSQVELYSRSYKDGIADDFFSTRWFVNYANQNHNISCSGVKDILSTLALIDIQKMFRVFVNEFIEFIKPVIQAYDIDTIVLGGNISRAKLYFENDLRSRLEKYNVETIFSKLFNLSTLVGAASIFKINK